MLQLSGVTKAFGNKKVLSNVQLDLEAGQITCLIGANAAGKTTLLSILAGLQKADSGQINLQGRRGFVPQEPVLLEELSVQEFLTLWYTAHHCSAKRSFEIGSAERSLQLEPYRHRRIAKLSGGIKKRVSIAGALTGDPEWLLMDEPFTALDLPSRQMVLELLTDLAEEGKGIFFSSHDPSAIAGCANRIVLLKDGMIQECSYLEGSEESRLSQVLQMLAKV